MRPDIKKDFSRFLSADPARLHMAAHSHHFWPDVTFDAHMQAWQDAARYVDDKWAYVLGTVYRDVQKDLAALLALPSPDTIAFAPNTHEFVNRLLSCLPQERPLRILTSDSEFYSFERQMRRLEEEGLAEVKRVPAQPLENFTTRFAKAASEKDYDLVYVSMVFFNSGFVVTPLTEIVRAVKSDRTLIAIDAYHGFMALPVDLSGVAERIFFIGGGYKYAMAGEGACFMHCPPDIAPRPRNTGWFAAFGALAKAAPDTVAYGTDGSRFTGATTDPSGLYRLRSVLQWLRDKNISIADIHRHAHALQKRFVEGLGRHGKGRLNPDHLLVGIDEPRRGNFLTFKTAEAGALHDTLKQHNVITDYRGDCLRFGFGPYHDAEDIDRLLEIINRHVR